MSVARLTGSAVVGLGLFGGDRAAAVAALIVATLLGLVIPARTQLSEHQQAPQAEISRADRAAIAAWDEYDRKVAAYVKLWRTQNRLSASSDIAMALASLRVGNTTLTQRGTGGEVSYRLGKGVSKADATQWVLGHPFWRSGVPPEVVKLWHFPPAEVRSLADIIYNFDNPRDALAWATNYQKECDKREGELAPGPDPPIRPTVADPRGLPHAKDPVDTKSGWQTFKMYEDD